MKTKDINIVPIRKKLRKIERASSLDNLLPIYRPKINGDLNPVYASGFSVMLCQNAREYANRKELSKMKEKKQETLKQPVPEKDKKKAELPDKDMEQVTGGVSYIRDDAFGKCW